MSFLVAIQDSISFPIAICIFTVLHGIKEVLKIAKKKLFLFLL
jgi:hypothetical protein